VTANRARDFAGRALVRPHQAQDVAARPAGQRMEHVIG